MAEQERRSRNDVEAQIVAKAWSDEAFAQELRANPKAAIEKELGGALQDDLEVQVHFESAEDNTFHLVIPAKPSQAELSAEELEHVAGGGCRDTAGPMCRGVDCADVSAPPCNMRGEAPPVCFDIPTRICLMDA